MLKGLFINQKKAQCSIYEAGVLIKNCLMQDNSKYVLDYIETDKELTGISGVGYDFYIINWHFITLSISKPIIQKMKGFRIAIILEVGINNYAPHPYEKEDFDAYMVIDPTKQACDRYYPFPRPLPLFNLPPLKPILSDDKLVIGSFGFVGYDLLNEKKFEELVLLANNSKRDSIVRLNFPSATFINLNKEKEIKYENYLKSLANSNVNVTITHKYFTHNELIQWLSEHTINCFPYYRTRPGLSAVTDQAVVAGRAIAVTSCETFRHLHKYIKPYSQENILELTTTTLPGIHQMQIDWHPIKFQDTFFKLLLKEGVINEK